MSKKLSDILAANRVKLDATAIDIMRQELNYLDLHKQFLFRLLSYERLADEDVKTDETLLKLSGAYYDLKLTEVKRFQACQSNVFSIATEVCEYDLAKIQRLVKWPLLASDEINHFAALRAHYDLYAAEDYGPTQEWVIWYLSDNGLNGESILKVRSFGRLSRLYGQFPDELSRSIRDHAGIRQAELLPSVVPCFIIRATALERYLTKHGETLNNVQHFALP